MYKGRHIRRRRWWVAGTWALIAALALLLLIPFIEPYRLQVETRELESEQLPVANQALRVVFVSDIHMGGWPFFTAGRLRSLVSDINRQRPDLVLLGGDYASSPEQTLAFLEALPAISANLGIFAVLGETDRPESAADLQTLRDAMKARNITLLVNEAKTVSYGDGRITIAGLDEPQRGRPDLFAVARQVHASDYVILLAHNPSLIEDANKVSDAEGAQDWFDLALFGHTHGNQFFGRFNPLGIAPDVTTASHRKDWVREGRSDILISRGVGTSVLPVRLGCAPMIHRIDIRNPETGRRSN